MEDFIQMAQNEFNTLLDKLADLQPDGPDRKEFWLTVADTFEAQAQEIRKGLVEMRVGEILREEDQMRKRMEKNKKRRKQG